VSRRLPSFWLHRELRPSRVFGQPFLPLTPCSFRVGPYCRIILLMCTYRPLSEMFSNFISIIPDALEIGTDTPASPAGVTDYCCAITTTSTAISP
jgi:hypothetical protein